MMERRSDTMANIKSQKKRILTNEKARQSNQHFRSHMRTMIKKALVALTAKDASVPTVVRDAVSAIDRACTKGVIHRNAAARKKSELQHRAAHLYPIADTLTARLPHGSRAFFYLLTATRDAVA